MAKTTTDKAYAAWGLAILFYVVPTAATAGLLTILARTIDHTAQGIPLWLGWFVTVLFVVSTGHSEKHDDHKSVVGVLFDLAETFTMVAAFHALGLVTTNDYLSNGMFFVWLGWYLLTILGRRFLRRKRNDAQALALKNSWADQFIATFTWFVTAASLLIGYGHDYLANRGWANAVDYWATIVLWLILIIYSILAFVREGQIEPQTQTR